MEDVIFSIIVPIYNVEQYLELCLDSIVAQAFNSKEIICVEDCSTDDSLSVLLKYEKNEKIKIIRHEKNKGLSGARNTGIKHAQGKYILFVDSDDVLANNALEILYNAINEQEMDVVYFDFRKFVKKENGYKEVLFPHPYYTNEICDGKKYFCESVRNKKLVSVAWRQLIRKDFLLENDLCFMEGLLHEDELFSFMVSMHAKKIKSIKDVLYFYRQRHNSIMNVKNEKHAHSLFVILLEILTYWKTNTISSEVSECIGMYWKSLYDTYLLYKAYVNEDVPFEIGDAVERTIYQILNAPKNIKWLEVSKLPLDEIGKAPNVAIFGAGKAAKQVAEYMFANNLRVSCFLVQEKEINADFLFGIPVYGIDEYEQRVGDTTVIIGVTAKYASGIENNLYEKGFTKIIKLPDGEGN